MNRHYVRIVTPMALAVLLMVSACDTGDPISPPSPAEVEGIYTLTEFRFDPVATGVQPANVLDALVLANTSLELFGSRAALFRFRIQNEPTDIVAGEFDVSATQVRLRLTDPGGRLPRLLLTPTLVYDRQPDGSLRMDQATTVNLAAYDPQQYAGLTQVAGMLRMRWVPVDN